MPETNASGSCLSIEHLMDKVNIWFVKGDFIVWFDWMMCGLDEDNKICPTIQAVFNDGLTERNDKEEQQAVYLRILNNILDPLSSHYWLMFAQPQVDNVLVVLLEKD